MVKGLREEIAKMPYPRLVILLACIIVGSVGTGIVKLYADNCEISQQLIETERRAGSEKADLLEKMIDALNKNAKASEKISENQDRQNELMERIINMRWRDDRLRSESTYQTKPH